MSENDLNIWSTTKNEEATLFLGSGLDYFPTINGKEVNKAFPNPSKVEYSRNSWITRQMLFHACDQKLIGQEKAKAWHAQTLYQRERNHSCSRGSKFLQNGSVSTSAPNRRRVTNSTSESPFPSVVEFKSNSSCLETQITSPEDHWPFHVMWEQILLLCKKFTVVFRILAILTGLTQAGKGSSSRLF